VVNGRSRAGHFFNQLMTTFEIRLGDAKVSLPKSKLFTFFVQNPALFNAAGYNLRASVPVEVFRAVAASLIENRKLRVTLENVSSVSRLAEELSLEELLADCQTLLSTVTPEALSTRISALEGASGSALAIRVSKIENELSRCSLESVLRLEDQLHIQERELERLGSCVSELESELLSVKSRSAGTHPAPDVPSSISQELKDLESRIQSDLSTLNSSIRNFESNMRDVESKLATLPVDVECPMQELNSLNGIISFLANKCKGNVHELRLVNVTAKSVNSDFSPPRSLVELNAPSFFMSNSRGDQWICYEFRRMRIRPTRYAFQTAGNKYDGRDAGFHPKSWVVETSLDEKKWTEVDRQTNVMDANHEFVIRSFPLVNAAECRYIRFTQTQNHKGNGFLALSAFEIFGTLIQSRT
jgi:hypothetical protein